MNGEKYEMNPKLPSKFTLAMKNIARLLVLETAALFISVFLIFTLSGVFITFGTSDYEPPPFGEKDLELGMRIGAWGIFSFLFSIPLSVLIHIYFFWKFYIIYIRRNKDE